MNVKQIVAERLKLNGYDGLCNQSVPCACLLGDLSPCGEMSECCEAGHRVPCDGTCEDGKCEFHIKVPTKMEECELNSVNWVCDCGERCNPVSPD